MGSWAMDFARENKWKHLDEESKKQIMEKTQAALRLEAFLMKSSALGGPSKSSSEYLELKQTEETKKDDQAIVTFIQQDFIETENKTQDENSKKITTKKIVPNQLAQPVTSNNL